MSDDFSTFHAIKQRGESATGCARAARDAGLTFFERIRMLRAVFGVSITDAKEAIIITEGRWSSLDEYQEQLLPALEAAIKAIESEWSQKRKCAIYAPRHPGDYRSISRRSREFAVVRR
jgi:hypothetical protein